MLLLTYKEYNLWHELFATLKFCLFFSYLFFFSGDET